MDHYEDMTRAELIARLHALQHEPNAINRFPGPPKIGGSLGEPDLRGTEERLRAILQTAVEGIITIDERGIIESVNPAAERIFEFSSAELVGKNVSVLMPSPHREGHDGYLSNYLRTGQARIIGIGREVAGRRKDGTVFPMDLAVSEVRLTDRRLFTGFVRDITERKRLEQEVLEISDLERRRIGQDLHDGLCQHLAGIELMSQVLEQKLADKSKTDAARAAEIAGHVRAAISQTRSLARGLSPVTLESEGLVSALRELAENAVKLFGVNCSVDCSDSRVTQPVSVATHLYRIAQEAVSNAVKHGKANRIGIRLSAASDLLVLSVEDNGKGMTDSAGGKNGMGLRIMQYRAAMVGGRLGIESNPARGVTVTCSLPGKENIPKSGS